MAREGGETCLANGDWARTVNRVFLTVAAGVASVLWAISLASAWEYVVQEDDFDGSKREFIFSRATDGFGTLVIFAGRGGHINNPAVSIQWTPGVPYICNSSPRDTEFVEWLIVGRSDEHVSREFLTTWGLSLDRKTVFVGDERSRETGKYESRELIDAMLLGEEARFRFTDDCGEKLVGIFPLAGFQEAVDQLNGDSSNERRGGGVVPALQPVPEPPALVAAVSSDDQNTEMIGRKIYYGSREGMTVTIGAASGIDTALAVIEASITRADAEHYCREYVGEESAQCILNHMRTELKSTVAGSCESGVFQDFFGTWFQFMGPMNPAYGQSTGEYAIVDLRTRKLLDDSMASGYYTALGILDALCPSKDLQG